MKVSSLVQIIQSLIMPASEMMEMINQKFSYLVFQRTRSKSNLRADFDPIMKLKTNCSLFLLLIYCLITKSYFSLVYFITLSEFTNSVLWSQFLIPLAFCLNETPLFDQTPKKFLLISVWWSSLTILCAFADLSAQPPSICHFSYSQALTLHLKNK